MTYTQPILVFFLLVAFIGVARLKTCPKRWLPLIAIFALALITWPPVTVLLSQPLEGRYPIRPFDTRQNYGAIVVLAGSVSPPQFERPYYLPDDDSFHRCLYAAWVYGQKLYTETPYGQKPSSQKPVRVLVCGGSPRKKERPYAETMRETLLRLNVPEEAILMEDQSHSTHENALYGARLLRQYGISRIALVTDAASMPRAAACFTREQITVIPAPSDFFEPQNRILPSWQALRQDELILHESLGLAWYRLRGWI